MTDRTPFLERSFDITSTVMHSASENELVVGIFDSTGDNFSPKGKQSAGRLFSAGGIAYTSTTGIWGTVWLEGFAHSSFVAPDSLRLHPSPELDGIKVNVSVIGTDGAIALDANAGSKLSVRLTAVPSTIGATQLAS